MLQSFNPFQGIRLFLQCKFDEIAAYCKQVSIPFREFGYSFACASTLLNHHPFRFNPFQGIRLFLHEISADAVEAHDIVSIPFREFGYSFYFDNGIG